MTDRLLPFDAPLERLKALHPKSIDLNLDRMLRVCEALGNPQDRLPPVIHVAGTNGKGSTLAFLRAMAVAEGLRVHVYTSPHLVRFAERIRIDNRLITDDHLAGLLERVETANAGQPLTFFEATTAAAFLAFAETPGDVLLLETGLGGILDATNIIARPKVVAITPIDFDHQGFLGDDLPTIAKQKAGIVKAGVPVICARQADDALHAIERQTLKMRAPLRLMGRDFDVRREGGRLLYETGDSLMDLPLPRLKGGHQVDNAGVAIAAAQAFGLSEAAIETGLTTAEWPGRLQMLRAGPLFDALPHESELWLDGGHNPHAARALREFIDDMEARDSRPLHMICGLINSKDAGEFFGAFTGVKADVTCVPFSSDAAIDPADLAWAANNKGLLATTAESPLDAIKTLPQAPCRVLICGSLYLVGDVLAMSPKTWPV